MKKATARGAARPRRGKPCQATPAKDRMWGSDDAEGWYRRGFEHGAYLTFESAKQLFDSEAGRERLRQWVEVELRQWRLASLERPEAAPPMPPKRKPGARPRA